MQDADATSKSQAEPLARGEKAETVAGVYDKRYGGKGKGSYNKRFPNNGEKTTGRERDVLSGITQNC